MLLCLSSLLVFMLGWIAFSSVCQAQPFSPTTSFPPSPSPFGSGFPGSQGQLPPSTTLPFGFGPQPTPVPTSPLGPISQEGIGFGGSPGSPIPFGGLPGSRIPFGGPPGPPFLNIPAGTQGFTPGGTSLGGFPTPPVVTSEGNVFMPPSGGFVPQPAPPLARPPAVNSFPVSPNIILSTNAPLILNASFNPVVFRSSQVPGFIFRSGAAQTIDIRVEVMDPQGVGDIAEISFDAFTGSGLISRVLVLGQTHILSRDDGNRKAIFGIENLPLSDIPPQVLLFIITAFDRSGNESNTWPFISFVQISP